VWAMHIMWAMKHKGMQNNSIGAESTNIRIKPETKDRLSAVGRHGDSFDSIIQKLLAFWDKNTREKK